MPLIADTTLHKPDVMVRKTIDYYSATYAITYGHELLHADGASNPFGAHLGLRVIHLQNG